MSKNEPESTDETIDIRFPFTRLSTPRLGDETTSTTTETDESQETMGESVVCKTLPMQPNRTECQCNNCGESWSGGDEWEKHVVEKQTESIPQAVGDVHKYECPTCEQNTFKHVSPLSISNSLTE